jgi:two-component sensor histidine kinase
MTELIGNAAKHAYPNGARGQIWVNLARVDGDAARVSVRDDGVGLSTDFESTKKVGLGMRLVRALAKQTQAEFRVERHARGTEFVLEIPLT